MRLKTKLKDTNNKHYSFNIDLDPWMIFKITKEDNDIYSFYYSLDELNGDKIPPIKSLLFTVLLTNEKAYLNAVASVDVDDAYCCELECYMEDDLIPFSVILNKSEKEKILILIIKDKK